MSIDNPPLALKLLETSCWFYRSEGRVNDISVERLTWTGLRIYTVLGYIFIGCYASPPYKFLSFFVDLENLKSPSNVGNF